MVNMKKHIYYSEGGVVKGKFIGCDTSSLVFKAMDRRERDGADTILEQSFSTFRDTLPKPPKAKTFDEKVEEILKTKGLI